MISIIVAMAQNGVIGKDGKIPWRIKDDIERFKQHTMGHPVIMGRNTWVSIPNRFRPLPGRTNIVLTRNNLLFGEESANYMLNSDCNQPNKEHYLKGAYVARSVKEAFKLALMSEGSDEIFVIGGAGIYEQFLLYADKLYITRVNADVTGDIYFPRFDEHEWEEDDVGTFEANDRNEYSGFWQIRNRWIYPIVAPINGRTIEYQNDLTEILESGRCPFCPDGVTWTRQEIYMSDECWIITKNVHPLNGSRFHFLIVPRRHVTLFSHLTPAEIISLQGFLMRIKENNSCNGIVWYCREGNPITTGATVQHFHIQLIVPKQTVTLNFGMYVE